MKEPEYKRLRQKIEAEYREKLKALDMVFQISGGVPSSAKNNDAPKRSKGVITLAVQNALPNVPADFDVRDIEREIKNADPNAVVKRASISSTLKRMADDKKIQLVEEGKGKRPSKYRK